MESVSSPSPISCAIVLVIPSQPLMVVTYSVVIAIAMQERVRRKANTTVRTRRSCFFPKFVTFINSSFLWGLPLN